MALSSLAPDREASEKAVREAIERCTGWLLDHQHPEGYWWAELESNVTMASEFVLLQRFLGTDYPTQRLAKIGSYIRRRQNENGGWSVWYGGDSDVSVTAEAYFALKLCGDDPAAEHMARARQLVLSKGGIREARVFTKLWLALFGQFDYDALPAMPPELIFLPPSVPLNIYDFSSWARATIVAILPILDRRPVAVLPPELGVQELYANPSDRSRPVGKKDAVFSWRNGFLLLDRALRPFVAWRSRPTREPALRRVERWIIEHQEADGSWGGIQPPWVYALMALKALGHGNEHPVIAKGLRGWETFTLETDEELTVQPCLSPVWDTCLTVIGLLDSGTPSDHPAVRAATDWLLRNQIFAGGDWQVTRSNLPPGGWAFEFANDHYPDTDDTAEVIIALKKAGVDKTFAGKQAIEKGLLWLAGMQSRTGGWGSFDVDNDRALVTKIPFCDFGETIDPPTEDVTAHVVECLALNGYSSRSPSLSRAYDYLRRSQESNAAWWGRWGVNYVYGTGAVLPALEALGEDMSQRYIRRAIHWLVERQNGDGGWGEDCESYRDPTFAGHGPSTPSQTAWALMALIAAGEARSEEARRGVDYLLRTQTSDGDWAEDYFTGTGFPGDFMLKYHYYRVYFPLTALGRYVKALDSADGV